MNNKLTIARAKIMQVAAELDLRWHRAEHYRIGAGRQYKEWHDTLQDVLTALYACTPGEDTRCECGHRLHQHGMPDGQVCHEQLDYAEWCDCGGFEEKK